MGVAATHLFLRFVALSKRRNSDSEGVATSFLHISDGIPGRKVLIYLKNLTKYL